MALSYAHGAVTWTTGAIGTTFAISGLSFQPKAIRAWTLGYSSGSDATSALTPNLHHCIGFATSTSDRRSLLAQSTNNVGTCNATAGHRDDCILHLSATQADSGRLDISAIAADGFTFRVDVVAVQANTVFWEAWGGSDITAAETGESTERNGAGATDYTLAGAFQPSVVMLCMGQATTANTMANTDAGLSFGCATGAASQWVFCHNEDDGSTVADTDRYGNGDECLAMIVNGGGNPDARAAFTQFNSDGFRLTWGAGTASARRFIYLAIAGGSWKAGDFTLDTTTLNTTATVSGLAFTPVGATVFSHGTSEQAAGTGATTGALADGCFDNAASRRGIGFISEDNVASSNMEIDFAIEYDQVLPFPNVTGSPPGVLKSVDLDTTFGTSGIASDGFRLIVDVAGGATTDMIGYLAFGDAAAGGGTTRGMPFGNRSTAFNGGRTLHGPLMAPHA